MLPSLTSLRWVAALLVLGYHLHVVEFFAPHETGATLLAWLFKPGSVGVSFFFILSGFVLMWSSPSTRAPRFWWRRFARVYPLHLATAAIVLVLLWTEVLPGETSVGAIAVNLLLVQAWSSDIEYVQSLNTVSWTLSCEAFFYLLFPLIAAVVRRLRPGGVAGLAAISTAMTMLAPLAGRLVANDEAVAWFLHWNPAGRLPEFVLGVALASMVRTGHERGRAPVPHLWAWAGVVVVIGYALTSAVPEPFRHAACTMPGFALVLVAAASSDLADRPSLWRNAVLVRLGEVSFAFYLVHLLVIRIAEVIVGYHPKFDDGKAVVLTLTTFLLSLSLAWLLHRYVERPARSLLLPKQPTGRDTRPQPAVAAEVSPTSQ